MVKKILKSIVFKKITLVAFLLVFAFLGQVFFLKKKLLAGSFFYFLSFFSLFSLLKALDSTFTKKRIKEKAPKEKIVKNFPRAQNLSKSKLEMVKFFPRAQKFTKELEKGTWVVIAVFLLSIILRGVSLKNIPYLVDGDSSRFAIEGERVFQEKPPLFSTNWQGHTNFYLFFVGLFLNFFGNNLFGIRLLSSLGGILSLFALYLFTLKLFGKRIAFWSLLLAGIAPFHLTFSRVGTEVIHVTYLALFSLLLFYEGFVKKTGVRLSPTFTLGEPFSHPSGGLNRGWINSPGVFFLFSGLLAGLAQYIYPGARLIPILILIEGALLSFYSYRVPGSSTYSDPGSVLLCDPGSRSKNTKNSSEVISTPGVEELTLSASRDTPGAKKLLTSFGLFFLGMIIVWGPMLFFYLQHPDKFFLRINQVSIFTSPFFAKELVQKGVFTTILNQFFGSFFVFFYPVMTGGLAWFYRQPYLELTTSIFLIFGVFLSLLRAKSNWRLAFILAWLLVGCFLAGVLTFPAPTPARYLILFFPAIILSGIGADFVFNQLLTFGHPTTRASPLSDHFGGVLPTRRTTIRDASLVGQSLLNLFRLFLVLFILASNLFSFFHHEKIEAFDFDQNTQLATFAGRHLQNRKNQDFVLYFLGNSKMYFKAIPTLPFLTKKEGIDIFESIEEFLPKINRGERLIFILIPERKRELKVLKEYFPKGKQKDLYNPAGWFLGTIYETN